MTDRQVCSRAKLMAVMVCALSVASGTAADQQPAPFQARGFEEIYEWARLAASHETNGVDPAIRTAATWSSPRLASLLHDLRLVSRLMQRVTQEGYVAGWLSDRRPEDGYVRRFTLEHLEPLLGLPEGVLTTRDPRELARPDSAARRAIALVMAKGAMLHTDLMMISPEDLQAAGVKVSRSTTQASRVVDGQRIDEPSGAVHWDIARTAIDLIAPTPKGQPAVALWYHATSAFLLARRDYDSGRPHLEHATGKYPRDARIAFLLGAAYENLAAPRVQALADDDRDGLRLEPREALLAEAEKKLRVAREIEPPFAEAALRLGRVLELTSRHEAAVQTLEAARPLLNRSDLAYYAELFLGRALQSLGRDEPAHAAFGRARDLYPRAQSPHLALGQLAWRSAQPVEAAASIERLRDLDRESTAGPIGDPWWAYDVSPAFDARERIAAMRRAIEEFRK